jgi:hypothetical protein
MTRLTITLAAAAAFAGGLAAMPAPALAQAGQFEVVIYGNDPCPRDAICIRKKESERYRLPKNQQLEGTRQQRQSWTRRSQALTTVGQTGPGSCSAVGPGGFTGCLTQEINQARKDAQEQQQADQPPKL